MRGARQVAKPHRPRVLWGIWLGVRVTLPLQRCQRPLHYFYANAPYVFQARYLRLPTGEVCVNQVIYSSLTTWNSDYIKSLTRIALGPPIDGQAFTGPPDIQQEGTMELVEGLEPSAC